MIRKVFITGESGYIAESMVDLFEKNGFEVVNAHHSEKRKKFVAEQEYTLENKMMYKSFSHREPEFNIEEYEALRNAVEYFKPDLIVHNAAFVGSDICDLRVKDAILSNVLGTYNVIEVCKEFDLKMVFFGTTSIFGGAGFSTDDIREYRNSRFDERAPIDPHTLYGINKLDAELQVQKLFNLSDVIIVRPIFAFGNYPNDTSSAITRILYNGIANKHFDKNNVLPVRLHPKYFKDYIRVEDVANAVVHTVKNNYWGEDFNVCSGTGRRFSEYVGYVTTNYPGDYNIKYFNKLDYHKNHMADNSKLLATGWKPKYSFEDGIEMTYKSIIANIEKQPFWYISDNANKRKASE